MTREKRVFSPTPWAIQRSRGGPDLYVVNSDDTKGGTKLVAFIKSGFGIMASPYAEGDAVLLSEAPRMLRRLKQARNTLARLVGDDPSSKDAKMLAQLNAYLEKLEFK